MLPAASMEFVDVHGQIAAFIPPLHPCAVVEGKSSLVRLALAGADFGRESVRIGPHDHRCRRPRGCGICRAPPHFVETKPLHTPVSAFLEQDTCAPAVKAAADLHSRGAGSPDREAPALFAVVTLPGSVRRDLVGVEAVAVEERIWGWRGRFIRKTPFIAIFTEHGRWNR